jgi:hypothetical protein
MKTKAARQPTAKPRKRKPDDPEQFQRFVEAARKAQADESRDAFDQAFDRLAIKSKVTIRRP